MEENKIQEAEVEPVKSDGISDNGSRKVEEKKVEDEMEASTEVSEENIKPKGRSGLYVELALFLILGFLIGMAVKTEAVKKITIGFDDYKMQIFSGGYDINKLQVEQAVKQADEAQKQQDNQASGNTDQSTSPDEGSCSAQ